MFSTWIINAPADTTAMNTGRSGYTNKQFWRGNNHPQLYTIGRPEPFTEMTTRNLSCMTFIHRCKWSHTRDQCVESTQASACYYWCCISFLCIVQCNTVRATICFKLGHFMRFDRLFIFKGLFWTEVTSFLKYFKGYFCSVNILNKISLIVM